MVRTTKGMLNVPSQKSKFYKNRTNHLLGKINLQRTIQAHDIELTMKCIYLPFYDIPSHMISYHIHSPIRVISKKS